MMTIRKIPLFFVCILLFAICSPLHAASEWKVIHSGERRWEMLMADLEKASSYICLECFIIRDDEAGRAIIDILMRKAAEGVEVRMLFDDISNFFLPKRFFQEMTRTGAELRFFTDLDRWDALDGISIRDHRKIVVIDGKVGYLGGMNLSDDYRYNWKDTDLRVEGPVVADLERNFYIVWTSAGGSGSPHPAPFPRCSEDPVEIIAGGPAYPVFVKMYLKLFEEAKDYIYLQTPYLCPPDTLVKAMKAAADRGVDVRILIPQKADLSFMTTANKSFYNEMLEAGVRVFEYIPSFVHSKVFSCDDRLCWIGSVNFDNRSFYLLYEIGALIHDAETAAAEKRWFLTLIEDSHEVTLEETAAWSKPHRLRNRFVHRFKSRL